MRLIARVWPQPTGLAQRWAPVVSRLLALAAVIGMAMVVGSDLVGRERWFEVGLPLYIGLVFVGGLVSALGFDMISRLGRQTESGTDSPAVPRAVLRHGTEPGAAAGVGTESPVGTEPGVGRAMFGPLGAIVAIHLACALVISLLVVVAELAAGDSPDPSLVPTALFVAAVGGGFAWLFGTIVTVLVIWPIIHLLRRLQRSPGRRRDENDSVTAGSVFVLLTVLCAITAAIATAGSDLGPGSAVGQGLAALLLVWTDLGDEPWRVTAVWISRGTLLALVVAGVHWVRAVRPRPPESPPDDPEHPEDS